MTSAIAAIKSTQPADFAANVGPIAAASGTSNKSQPTFVTPSTGIWPG